MDFNESGNIVNLANCTPISTLVFSELTSSTLLILTILTPIPLPAGRLLFHRFFWGQFSVLHFFPDYFHFCQMDFHLQLLDYPLHKLDGCCTVQVFVLPMHFPQFIVSSLQELGSFCFYLVFHAFNLILHLYFFHRIEFIVKETKRTCSAQTAFRSSRKILDFSSRLSTKCRKNLFEANTSLRSLVWMCP